MITTCHHTVRVTEVDPAARRLSVVHRGRRLVEAPPPVPDLRQDRLLRREPQPPRQRPLPRRQSRDHPVGRTRRGLDLVLRGRGEPPQDRGRLGGGRPVLRGRHVVRGPARSSRQGTFDPAPDRVTARRVPARRVGVARIARSTARASSTRRRPPSSRRSPAGTGRPAPTEPGLCGDVPPRTTDRERSRIRFILCERSRSDPAYAALPATARCSPARLRTARAGQPSKEALDVRPRITDWTAGSGDAMTHRAAQPVERARS